MYLRRFIQWCETATANERADGFRVLAREILEPRCGVVDDAFLASALSLALEDTSSTVRQAVAEAIGTHPNAPPNLVQALLWDLEPIAAAVAVSPRLEERDLLAVLPQAGPSLRLAIARRRPLSRVLAEALVGLGSADVCYCLLVATEAALDEKALRSIADRFGSEARIRTALLARSDLPADLRQTMVADTASALAKAPFVVALLGNAAARRVSTEACARATYRIAETVEGRASAAFADHLRTTGQLSAAFILRAACTGHIDLVAASLGVLSGLDEKRIRSVLVEGREAAFRSLCLRSGLATAVGAVVRDAVAAWKLAVSGIAGGAGKAELTFHVIERVRARFERTSDPDPEVSIILCRLGAEARRDVDRLRLDRLLAA